jgi:hypothetical protein
MLVFLGLHDGATEDQIFDAWRAELLRHRASAKTLLAQHALGSWSDRKNVPYWQVHAQTRWPVSRLGHSGRERRSTLSRSPRLMARGFFLKDMYIITKDGAELFTPGVPYSAEEIEAAMR